ncbi:hypothetical protein [Mangrovibrevibacter kandeliae]|uniref:hypothetical protein n=1 Tax=Mangrovibrevibacter kandeliae TaxID=2968473 RepID=UPI0021184E01|nr:hypothetical protein [Aurantimonas sp. CSK15Z-1]MCQ8783662.1 hypothetical protein [Aurantimonas sp. CSK15Z-1]
MAGTIGDRLVDTKEAIDRAETAAALTALAIKIIGYRDEILSLPGLCKLAAININDIQANNFALTSCCATIPEGGINAAVGKGLLPASWFEVKVGKGGSRFAQATIDEIRDTIEEKAGKKEIGELLDNSLGTLGTACLGATTSAQMD